MASVKQSNNLYHMTPPVLLCGATVKEAAIWKGD